MNVNPLQGTHPSPFDFQVDRADIEAAGVVERAVVRHMRQALGLADSVRDDEGNYYPRKPFSDEVENEIDIKLLAEYHAGRLVVTT